MIEEKPPRQMLERNAAYRAGWEEGLFAPVGRTAPHSEAIRLFEGFDRLAFWQGHRDGRSMRGARYGSTPQPALAADRGI